EGETEQAGLKLLKQNGIMSITAHLPGFNRSFKIADLYLSVPLDGIKVEEIEDPSMYAVMVQVPWLDGVLELALYAKKIQAGWEIFIAQLLKLEAEYKTAKLYLEGRMSLGVLK
ncbi:MAG: hypothetical protein ACOZAJ_03975, partial [Patescibacteria group bacterium]